MLKCLYIQKYCHSWKWFLSADLLVNSVKGWWYKNGKWPRWKFEKWHIFRWPTQDSLSSVYDMFPIATLSTPVIPPENEHLIAWKASVSEGLENIQVHPTSTCFTACLHRDHDVGNTDIIWRIYWCVQHSKRQRKSPSGKRMSCF